MEKVGNCLTASRALNWLIQKRFILLVILLIHGIKGKHIQCRPGLLIRLPAFIIMCQLTSTPSEENNAVESQ